MKITPVKFVNTILKSIAGKSHRPATETRPPKNANPTSATGTAPSGGRIAPGRFAKRDRPAGQGSQPPQLVSWRVVSKIPSRRISAQADAIIRNLDQKGIELDTPCLEIDGIHISYDTHPTQKNSVYLEWTLPTGRQMQAIGEAVWFQRILGIEPSYAVGIRFKRMKTDDHQALMEFLREKNNGHVIRLCEAG